MIQNFEIYQAEFKNDYVSVALALEESQDFSTHSKYDSIKGHASYSDNFNNSLVSFNLHEGKKNIIAILHSKKNFIEETKNRINELTLIQLDLIEN